MVVAVYSGHGTPCPYMYCNNSSSIVTDGVRGIAGRIVHSANGFLDNSLDL